MKMKVIISGFLLATSLLANTPLQADKIKRFRTERDANIYGIQHYNQACRYYNQQEWRSAANEFEKVVCLDSGSTTAADAYYFLGICFFQLKEYDFANHAFSNYLKVASQPEFFEEALSYKFCIAEYFKAGQKRRLFKIRYCPKWATSRTMALNTYDEIVVALPNHHLAAQSLFSKGCLLQAMGDYRDAVETFQTLIRRFPRHELTPQSYVKIAESYCVLSVTEYQNPDLLGLAEVNARRFKDFFPRDEQIETVEGYINRMKENYANGLANVGRFYERLKKPSAAVLYYQSAIEEFPDTQVAQFCRQRLCELNCAYEEDREEMDCQIETGFNQQNSIEEFNGLDQTGLEDESVN